MVGRPLGRCGGTWSGLGNGAVRDARFGGFLHHHLARPEQMKFLALVVLTASGALLLVHTLNPPLMEEGARLPLTGITLLLAIVTPLIEWWLRPKAGATSGSHVRKVMGMTTIKMFLMLGIILAYLVSGQPEPRIFGLASYLIYLAFTGILVAESMRHTVPPTDPR